MTAELQHRRVHARQRTEYTPLSGREPSESAAVERSASFGTARLRFWRATPQEAGGILCGEGAIDELPIQAHDAVRITLPASPCIVTDGRRCGVAVRPGQVHVAAPLELHGARSLDGAPCEMRVVLVGPPLLSIFGDELARRRSHGASTPPQLVVDDARLYEELWAAVGELRGAVVSLACVARMRECLTRLLRALAAQPPQAAPPRHGRQATAIRRARDYLRAHIAQNVSLDELAAVAGLSKFYLLRAFHRAYGITPHAYHMQLRLALAWRLIVDGNALSRATYDAGFADQSHLTRRFAALFGITPARYARQLATPPGRLPATRRYATSDLLGA